MSRQTTNGKAEFVFTYEFNAPKKLVFGAFSDANALNEWWGPVETSNSVIKLDFKPGGIFHYRMVSTKGTHYGRFLFKTISPYDLLEFTNAFADEKANIVKAPFPVPLPIEIMYSLRFEEKNGKTILRMTGTPVNGTGEEIEGFLSINEGMNMGFRATFDKLAACLNKS